MTEKDFSLIPELDYDAFAQEIGVTNAAFTTKTGRRCIDAAAAPLLAYAFDPFDWDDDDIEVRWAHEVTDRVVREGVLDAHNPPWLAVME